MVVIGVDPGQTTGIAAYVVPAADKLPVLEHSLQWGDYHQVVLQLRDLRYSYEQRGFNNIVFVVEQFDKRPGVADPDFTPKFIINDIEQYMSDEIIVWLTPAQAKNLVKPANRGASDGLKRFGWYKVGMGHSNDASRHVITFLVEKLKHMPTIKKGWPPRGDS